MMLLASCSSQEASRQVIEPPPVASLSRASPPDWIVKTPRTEGRVCATGAVDPTFYRQDGVRHASASARRELARTVEVEISTAMVDVETSRGTRVDQSFVQHVVESLSEAVLHGSQISEVWYDELGSVSRRGMTYALACMHTDRSTADLASQLKAEGNESDATIQDVKDRAEKAFEELERAEDKDSD